MEKPTKLNKCLRFLSGDVEWEVCPTESGIQVRVIPSARACAMGVLPVVGNTVNIIPLRADEHGRLLSIEEKKA